MQTNTFNDFIKKKKEYLNIAINKLDNEIMGFKAVNVFFDF